MSLIEARDLTKVFRQADKEPGFKAAAKQLFVRRFQEKVAVDHVDLSIEAGEAVAYVGPNGAGKSTTVKLLSGIIVPTSGEVRIAGLVPHLNRKATGQRIGVLFGQRTQLWWDLPVADSLNTLRHIYGVDNDTYRRRLSQLDEVLELKAIMPSLARKLSLGQRMRADLAAALIHGPQVLFLDEPTIGLDIEVKDRVREFLRRLRDEGITIMLTSHDLQDIEGVCRRLVIVDTGRVVFDGDLAALKDEYARDRIMHVEVDGAVSLDVLQASLPDMEVTGGDTPNRFSVRFDRFRTTAGRVVSVLNEHAELIDFHVDEPSIEDVIRRAYAGELTGQPAR